MKYPLAGLYGWQPGVSNHLTSRDSSDDEFKVKHTADWVPIPAGQRLCYDYGGGGGWGDPLERDPQKVLDDVLDEYVSVEAAHRDYGVVLNGSLEYRTLAIDGSTPETLRTKKQTPQDSGLRDTD